MIVVLLGPPGCGKGTQSEILVKDHNFSHIATGNLLRAEIASGSELGLKVKDLVEAGQIAGDDLIVDMVRSHLKKMDGKSILFDGFPRTLPQAEALDQLMDDMELKVDHAISFDVDDQFLVERIVNRKTCKGCGFIYNTKLNPPKVDGVCDHCGSTDFDQRKDDDVETLKSRLKVYHNQVNPLLSFYRTKGILSEIDARESIEKVTHNLTKVILG